MLGHNQWGIDIALKVAVRRDYLGNESTLITAHKCHLLIQTRLVDLIHSRAVLIVAATEAIKCRIAHLRLLVTLVILWRILLRLRVDERSDASRLRPDLLAVLLPAAV